MRAFRTPSGKQIRLGRMLGEGRQGLVFAVEGTELFCAKIYLEQSEELTRRSNSLVQAPHKDWNGDGRDHLHLAWPQATLLDENGSVRGVLLPYIDGVVLADLLAGQREEALDEPGWRTSLAIAGRLARVVGLLHDTGVVIGDLSPKNVMVDRFGRITLIDCDTVQFADPVTGRRWPAEHFTPEYLPPEAFPKPPSPLSPRHDRFGLGVLICQVLMDGDHPFEGVPTATRESVGIEDNIQSGYNRITRPGSLTPRAGELPAELLPDEVLQLAVRCLGEGAADPGARPRPAEWSSALGRAGFGLMGCRRDGRHAYPVDLGVCPWCARTEAIRVARTEQPTRSVPRPQAPSSAPVSAPVSPAPAVAVPSAQSEENGGISRKAVLAGVILAVVILLLFLVTQ